MRVPTGSLAALILVNLVPLVGVTVLGWNLYDVMLLYWLENGVVGAFMILRILTAAGAGPGAIGMALFFSVHYGIFWTVHGGLVGALFSPAGPNGGLPFPLVGGADGTSGLGIAILGLVVSHGISYVQNWWIAGEREYVTEEQVVPRAYGRVVALHVAILAGGFAAQAVGAAIIALVVLVVVKIGIDAAAHIFEHRTT